MPPAYDYIFSGAGCAGLSLLIRMLHQPSLAHKKILLADMDDKKSNDRTWCFWERDPGFFEPVVYRSWDQFAFHGPAFSKTFSLHPYRYKMIRGIDFYDYCFQILKRFPNVTILHDRVENVQSENDRAFIEVKGKRIDAGYVFNSIMFGKPALSGNEQYFLQHFKGWLIQTPEPVFDPRQPVFMDFRVPQTHGTAFAYVLPFSETSALVEYTLFTRHLLQAHEYQAGLQQYLHDIAGIKHYNILEEEFGIIPMTNHVFSPGNRRLVHIGTAGGHTKASSGYTFQFIQKRTAQMTNALVAQQSPLLATEAQQKKFMFYDSVLLHVLAKGKPGGAQIFETLFRKNDARSILRVSRQ